MRKYAIIFIRYGDKAGRLFKEARRKQTQWFNKNHYGDASLLSIQQGVSEIHSAISPFL